MAKSRKRVAQVQAVNAPTIEEAAKVEAQNEPTIITAEIGGRIYNEAELRAMAAKAMEKKTKEKGYRQARMAKIKAEGRCYMCGKDSGGKAYCPICAEKQKEYGKASRAKMSDALRIAKMHGLI